MKWPLAHGFLLLLAGANSHAAAAINCPLEFAKIPDLKAMRSSDGDYRKYLSAIGLDLPAKAEGIVGQALYPPPDAAGLKYIKARNQFQQFYEEKNFKGTAFMDPAIKEKADAFSLVANEKLLADGYKTKMESGFLGKTIELLSGPENTSAGNLIHIIQDQFQGMVIIEPAKLTKGKEQGQIVGRSLRVYGNVVLSPPGDPHYIIRHEFGHRYTDYLLKKGILSPYHGQFHLNYDSLVDGKNIYSNGFRLDELLTIRGDLELKEQRGLQKLESDGWEPSYARLLKVYQEIVQAADDGFKQQKGKDLSEFRFNKDDDMPGVTIARLGLQKSGSSVGSIEIFLVDVDPAAPQAKKVEALQKFLESAEKVIADDVRFANERGR